MLTIKLIYTSITCEKLCFNQSSLQFLRVVELVKDFDLKKLVVMKTIHIKSMMANDLKVKIIKLK